MFHALCALLGLANVALASEPDLDEGACLLQLHQHGVQRCDSVPKHPALLAADGEQIGAPVTFHAKLHNLDTRSINATTLTCHDPKWGYQSISLNHDKMAMTMKTGAPATFNVTGAGTLNMLPPIFEVTQAGSLKMLARGLLRVTA